MSRREPRGRGGGRVRGGGRAGARRDARVRAVRASRRVRDRTRSAPSPERQRHRRAPRPQRDPVAAAATRLAPRPCSPANRRTASATVDALSFRTRRAPRARDPALPAGAPGVDRGSGRRERRGGRRVGSEPQATPEEGPGPKRPVSAFVVVASGSGRGGAGGRPPGPCRRRSRVLPGRGPGRRALQFQGFPWTKEVEFGGTAGGPRRVRGSPSSLSGLGCRAGRGTRLDLRLRPRRPGREGHRDTLPAPGPRRQTEGGRDESRGTLAS